MALSQALSTCRTLANVLQSSGLLAAASNTASIRCMSSQAADSSNQAVPDEKTKMMNKLLYRSKQRGFLELDLLVGLWAEEHVPRMDMQQLLHLEQLLEQENPDLFKWITGQLPAPPELLQNPVFVAMQKSTAQQLAQRSPIAARAPQGRDWVRGWNDGNKKGDVEVTPGKKAD